MIADTTGVNGNSNVIHNNRKFVKRAFYCLKRWTACGFGCGLSFTVYPQVPINLEIISLAGITDRLIRTII